MAKQTAAGVAVNGVRAGDLEAFDRVQTWGWKMRGFVLKRRRQLCQDTPDARNKWIRQNLPELLESIRPEDRARFVEHCRQGNFDICTVSAAMQDIPRAVDALMKSGWTRGAKPDPRTGKEPLALSTKHSRAIRRFSAMLDMPADVWLGWIIQAYINDLSAPGMGLLEAWSRDLIDYPDEATAAKVRARVDRYISKQEQKTSKKGGKA